MKTYGLMPNLNVFFFEKVGEGSCIMGIILVLELLSSPPLNPSL